MYNVKLQQITYDTCEQGYNEYKSSMFMMNGGNVE